MKKFLPQITIAIICAGLGFLMVTQLRSVSFNKQKALEKDTASNRAEVLQVQLSQETEKSKALEIELLESRTLIEQYREEAAKGGDYASVLDEELLKASAVAGLTNLGGPGVIITMKDSPAAVTKEGEFIIHDDDILKVVNELRDAGAEAISINDERLLATSEIRCSGATVSVNNNRYAAPYIIKAIGDSKNLENALTMRYGVVEVLQSWGIEINIVRSNDLTIEGYKGVVSFKHASIR